MVFGSCFFLYTLFENCEPSGATNLPLALGLSLYSLIAICVYLFVQNPVFFQTIYGLTVFASIGRALYNIKYLAPCRQVRLIWALYNIKYLAPCGQFFRVYRTLPHELFYCMFALYEAFFNLVCPSVFLTDQ